MRSASISLGVAFALLCLVRPAHSQTGNLAETLQKEGQSQVSSARKYTTNNARARAYMSAQRSAMNFGSADATGRFDMAGKTPPGYFRLRDQSTNFSTRSYDSVLGRRPAARSTYSRKSAGSDSSRGIPPAPR